MNGEGALQTIPSDITDPLIRSDFATHTAHLLHYAPQASDAANPAIVFDRASDLFGIAAIPVEICKYQGPLPSGIERPRDGSQPLYEEAKVSFTRISDIFSELANTPFDLIDFFNCKFIHQNCLIDQTKNVGWSFECEVDLARSTKSTRDILQNVFDTSSIGIHLSALLACNSSQTWDTPLQSPSFILIGALDLSNVDLGDNLKLLTVGAKLHAVRTFFGPSKPSGLTYMMEFFGEMSILFPGSNKPSIFDFSFAEKDGIVFVSGELQGGEWDNAVGISDLKV